MKLCVRAHVSVFLRHFRFWIGIFKVPRWIRLKFLVSKHPWKSRIGPLQLILASKRYVSSFGGFLGQRCRNFIVWSKIFQCKPASVLKQRRGRQRAMPTCCRWWRRVSCQTQAPPPSPAWSNSAISPPGNCFPTARQHLLSQTVLPRIDQVSWGGGQWWPTAKERQPIPSWLSDHHSENKSIMDWYGMKSISECSGRITNTHAEWVARSLHWFGLVWCERCKDWAGGMCN